MSLRMEFMGGGGPHEVVVLDGKGYSLYTQMVSAMATDFVLAVPPRLGMVHFSNFSLVLPTVG